MADPLAALRKAPGILRLHGHRAARGVLPENTLLAFRNTFEIGVQVVELDVLITRDGIPVVTHNPRLMPASTRGPDGRWLEIEGPLISQLSLDQLQAYDVGGIRAGTLYASHYPDQAFLTGQRIPSLAQVARLCARPEFAGNWLNIELKSKPDAPENTPPLPELVARVVAVIREQALTHRVLVQSFDWRVLSELRAQAPDLPRSYLSFAPRRDPPMDVNVYEGSPWMDGASLAARGGSLPRTVADLGGAVWSPHFSDVTAQTVAEAQSLGLIVNVWTVNTPVDIQRMIELGVDGIITDYPGRVQRLLLARGLAWREDMQQAALAH